MFSLGRKIDFTYKTNKLIAIISIIVVVIGWALTGRAMAGLTVGLGTFLTWALSRELDPNHDYSAFLAAGFSLLNVFYFQNIQLLVIFWILLLMRTVNGITGKPLTTFDLISVLGLTGYLSLNTKNSIYLAVFIIAIIFVINSGEKKKEALVVGAISLGLFSAESFINGYFPGIYRAWLDPISLLVITTVGLSFILFWLLGKESIKDDLGNSARQSKIAASQILYSSTVLLLYFLSDMSFNNLVIYLSVLVGITIYYIGFKFIKRTVK